MNGIENYKAYLRHSKNSNGDNYLITGKDRTGKRIRIETKTPEHFNIYEGSLWSLSKDNKRKLIKRYFNF